MHTGHPRAIVAVILGLVLAACFAVPSWAVADEASSQAGTQTVEVDYQNRVVISDAAEAGKLTISGARSGNGTVDASTQIVLTSHDKASQDAFVRVSATKSTVRLTFDTFRVRSSETPGSPLELAGNDSGSGGSKVVLTLVGDNNSCNAASSGRAGISVPRGASLTIQGSGSLKVDGDKCAAGIGGGDHADSGDITINEGTITATSYDGVYDGAGAAIGGGCYGSSKGEITINGGTVTANGGKLAAGIGGGEHGTCGDVTIAGGTVTAKGGEGGAGIGSGKKASAAIGTIDISGGVKVTASSAKAGAGIGSGYDATAGGIVHIWGAGTDVKADSDLQAEYGVGGAGIGGGYETGGCDVTIEGGAKVTAAGGSGGPGIGSGSKAPSSSRNLTVRGVDTYVVATGGLAAAAIGTGLDGIEGGTVRIEGGRVIANPADSGFNSATGIGGGYESSGSTVIVTGGTVVARGIGSSGAIGAGWGGASDGTLTVTGGSVLASEETGEVETLGPMPTNGTSDLTRYVVALEGMADDTKLSGVRLYAADGTEIPYGQTTMWTTGATYHDGNSALYLYLPKGCDLGRVSLADGTTYLKKSVSGEGYLYAKASYAVTFDANDGTATPATTTQDLDWGVEEKLEANTFTRSGYTFLGWSKTKTATKADYSDGQSVTQLDDDPTVTSVTLYAVWAKLSDALISYSPSDTTAGSCTPASEKVEAGAAALTAKGSTAVPAEGHHFVDWTAYGSDDPVSTDATITPAQVDAVARAHGLYTSAALVANFAPNTYTVAFDANAPLGATVTGTMAAETGFSYGSSKGLTKNAYACAGYTFAGWKDADGTTYADGQQVTSLTSTDGGTVTLHAVWDANADIVLSYVPDDATHGSCDPATEALLSGGTATGSTAKAAAGYHLVDWTEAGTEVSTGITCVPTDTSASATYQANFAGNAYTVKFDANGAPGTMDDEAGFVYGTEKALTTSTLAWAGHVFAGWKVGETSRYVADGAKVADLTTGSATGTAVVTLHAVWFDLPEAAVSYSVEADAAGATHGSCDPAAESVGGTSVTPPSGSVVTPDAGWHLDATQGWTYANVQGGQGTVAQATPSATLTSAEASACCTAGSGASSWYIPCAFTAHLAANTYSVSFDANGGGGTMADQGMTYGQAATLTANTLARAGYTFAGWNTAADGSGTSYADGDPVSDLTTEDGGTVPLYAQWRQTYATLSYEASGSGTTDPELEVLGAATGTPLGSYAEADTGHHLVGWTWANASGSGTAGTSAELTPAQVAAVAKASGLYVDTTFTATFAANAYTVTFDAAGGSGTMSPQRMTYGEDAALEACTFSWAGHRFVGWSTEAGGTTATYDDGATVSDLTAEDGGTVALHAVWADATQSVIGYGAGEGGSVSPSSEVVGGTDAAVGSTATAADGYRFVAWVDAGGNVVSTDATFVPARPLLGWADATYTATFAKGDEPVTPDTPETPTSPDVPGSTDGSGTSGGTSSSARAVPSTGDPTLPVAPLVAASLALLGAALAARRRRA